MSGRGIVHFMWGYQPHFRIHQELFAERVFRLLDERFSPEVFSVGILDEPCSSRFPACVEPEDDFWIESEDLNAVHASAKELLASYPEAKLLQSHPLAQERQNRGLYYRSIRDAIKKIIDESPANRGDLLHYVSFPAKVNGYLVSTVLGLQRDIVGSYYSLKRGSVPLHEYSSVSTPVSLIDATASTFLEHSKQELLKPDPGLSSVDTDAEEIVRSAGDALCRGLVWRIDRNRLEAMHQFFRACNTISSLRYEGEDGLGRVVLARKDHPSIEPIMSFETPTKLKRYRAARKLLQLTSADLVLHSDTEQIFALVKCKGFTPSDEDLFSVEMLGHHYWEMKHGTDTLMRVQYGLPRLPRLSFEEQKFKHDLLRLFPSVTSSDIDRLVKLVRVAEKEPHGTLLVITESAESEAKRLKGQGTPIAPCVLTPEVLRHMTAIDGAILLTPKGVCHGIATILDGKAHGGDPGRGSRFNSAVRYVESTWPSLAVVVSEDGGIDFVPNLRPAVKRSAIDRMIQSLVDLAASSGRISKRRYSTFYDALDRHRFYLRHEDCEKLNPLIETLEKTIHEQENSQLWILRQPFKPAADFDEDLFYEKE